MISSAAIAERPTPWPEMTPSERAEHIKNLRELYSKPAAEWPAPTLDEGVEHRELGLLPQPAESPHHPSAKAKLALGRQLFFDPRLSGSRQIACASCHDPDLGWGDGRTVPFGHDRTRLARNAPSIVNSGLRASLFWDGRAGSLEDQAGMVVHNPDEMHSSEAIVATNLRDIPGYVEQFNAVFGPDSITLENAMHAIASFERSLVGGRSRFDSFLKGRDNAIPDEAIAGLHLFRTTARCVNCHNGPLLSDDKFHNIGLSNYGRMFEDLGRYEITGRAEDVGSFRTPSLRNVVNTAPYMHNGLFDLQEVLRLYNSGMPNPRRKSDQMDDPLFPTKSPHVKPLGLNDRDLADLEAFLVSLNEPKFQIRPPQLPEEPVTGESGAASSAP